MFKGINLRPSPGLIVAMVALVVALGGVAYGVTDHAPRDSVGSRSLKHGAVRTTDVANQAINSVKVRNHTVRKVDLANDVLADLAGASALNPVPSGKTIHGAVGGDFHAFDGTASDFGVDVTLPIPAANDLTDNDVFVNVDHWQDGGGQTPPDTTDTNAGCNGAPTAPTAPAGKVCIYVSGADHAFDLNGYAVLFGTQGSPYGFKLKWDASATGDSFVDGTWAYTAP